MLKSLKTFMLICQKNCKTYNIEQSDNYCSNCGSSFRMVNRLDVERNIRRTTGEGGTCTYYEEEITRPDGSTYISTGSTYTPLRAFNARLSTSGNYYFYNESNSIERKGYTSWERAFNRVFNFGDLFRTNTLKMYNVDEAREYSSDLQCDRIYISYPGHGLFHASP